MAFANNSMSNAEAGYIFDSCFGKAGIMEEELYYDPIRSLDKRTEIGEAIKKDMITKAGPSIGNTSGGTSTIYSLMPSFVDPSIVDKTVRATPLVKLLPRRAVRGRSYIYNLISAKAGAAFLDDDAPLADQVDTRDDASTQMKYLYAVGRVTGPALSSAEGFINLLAEDIRVKTASMNEALENEIVNGNTTTNANGFQGLIQSITTNTTDNSGVNVTLEEIRSDLNTSFEANGFIDLAVTDGSTFNYIKGLLMDFQRNVERPSGSMDFGIPDAFMFDGVLFIKDRYMPTTASSRRIIYLDSRYVFLAVLQDITFEELAKNNDSQKYMLKFYGSLIVTFESAMVQRYGLA